MQQPKAHVLQALINESISSITLTNNLSLRLDFEGQSLTLFNLPTLIKESCHFDSSHDHYFNTICQLPNRTLSSAEDSDGISMLLTFSDAFQLLIDLSDECYTGPEIMVFRNNTDIVVW